jgi:hypothetical protein
MSDWTPSAGNPGYIEKTIQTGPATVVILRPVMDREEQAKREQKTRDTLGNVLQDYIRRKDANHEQ